MSKRMTLTRGTCSFCGVENARIITTDQGSSICLVCLPPVNNAAGNCETGTLYCPRCENVVAFEVTYKDGKKPATRVIFSKFGKDEEGQALYLPVSTDGPWHRASSQISVKCVKCQFSLPREFWAYCTYI